MSRVLLINTTPFLEKETLGSDVVDPKPPIGLAYIAGELRRRGHSIRICDAQALGLGISEICDEVMRFTPQIIGANMTAATRRSTFELMNLLKKMSDRGKLPQMLRCVGGPEVTLNPYEPLEKCAGIDIAVSGEGELVMATLADTLTPDSSIHGLCYRKGSDIVFTGKSDRLMDLDSLAYPAIDLLPLDRYLKKSKKLYVMATRGCSYKCTFCCSPKLWNRQVTRRSAENVITEMRTYNTRYGVFDFHFLDDDLLLWGPNLMKFCELCESLGFRWRFICRVDKLKENELKIFRKAGCYGVTFGIESGSERIQRLMKKELDLAVIPAIIRKCAEEGIRTKAYFMLGFPSETPSEIEETVNYAFSLRALGLTDVSFLPVTPYKGTEVYDATRYKERYTKRGMLGEVRIAYDYDELRDHILDRLTKYSSYPAVSCNEYLDGISLRQIARRAYHLFYNQRISADGAQRILQREIAELSALRQ